MAEHDPPSVGDINTGGDDVVGGEVAAPLRSGIAGQVTQFVLDQLKRLREWKSDTGMMPTTEWDRNARCLKLLKILLEAQQIEACNETDRSWVTSSEMKGRLAKRGVNLENPQ